MPVFVIPTLTVNVFAVFEVIAKVFPCAGSPPAELKVNLNEDKNDQLSSYLETSEYKTVCSKTNCITCC